MGVTCDWDKDNEGGQAESLLEQVQERRRAKTQQTSEYTKTEADSQINETHYWLPVGREKGEGVR